MSLKKPRIAFIPTNVSGVMYYRCRSQADALKSLGCEVAVLWYKSNFFTMHPWEEDILTEAHGERIQRDIEMACQWADVVIWMGLHTPHTLDLFHAMKVKYGKPFITEMDDYIFSIPSTNTASTVYAPGTGLTRIFIEQIKASDALVVSTPYLAKLYHGLCRKVFVAENGIDLPLWRGFASPAPRRRVNIGWMGGGSHTDDFTVVKDAIMELLAIRDDVTFTFVSGGSCPEFFKDIPRLTWIHDFKSIDKYPKWIGKFGFDIGIAPLIDNNFNRGKSNLRWLEYSALGIPCVASPLPHFKESITHGVTGQLANSTEDWVNLLNGLVSAPDTRNTMGMAARQEVKDKWNLKLLGRKYKTAIEGLLNASIDTPSSPNLNRGLDTRPE